MCIRDSIGIVTKKKFIKVLLTGYNNQFSRENLSFYGCPFSNLFIYENASNIFTASYVFIINASIKEIGNVNPKNNEKKNKRITLHKEKSKWYNSPNDNEL